MSDIWIKQTTGTSSTTWKRAVNLFVKTTTGTTAAAWKAATSVYIYFSSGWTRVWPLSGVFNITSPYITTSSGSTTPLYGVDGVRRVGSVVFGKNGTWNANGWIINSYQYRWRAYNSSEISDLNRDSQTSLATYSSAVSLTIPATYDKKYLSFFIQANSSGGSAYNGFAESGVEYGGLQIVRQQPINISASLNNLTPQVGNTINFSSSWNITEAYAPEALRTTIEWYKNLNNSTTGGTFLSSGSYSYIVQSSDLNHYIYAVETTFNSGTDYDLGLNTGVSVSRITTSVVSAGLTAPTSTSIVSVSRLNDTQTRVVVSSSGGSGPNYQLYWISSSTAPTTPNYDAASPTSTVTEDYEFSNGITYYFYIRSSSEYLGPTTENGTGTAGTFSAYGPTTGAASYTFSSPSGGTASINGSTTVGSTLTLSVNNASSNPSPNLTSIIWRVNDGGFGGNSFTGGSVLQNGGTTFVIPQFLYGSVSSVGYQIRAEATWNNGVGSQIANSNAITVTSLEVSQISAPTARATNTFSTSTVKYLDSITWSSGTYTNASSISSVLLYSTNTSNLVAPGGNTSSAFRTANPYTIQTSDPAGTPYVFAVRDTVVGINGTTYYFYSNQIVSALADAVAFSYGSATSSTGGWTASINSGSQAGATYSYISATVGSGSVNSSTGAVTASGLSSNQSSTITVQKAVYGYNTALTTVSGTAATVVTYTLSYSANGGSTTPASQTGAQGTSITLAANAGTRSGFTFGGWNIGGVTYSGSGSYTFGSANATATAIWNAVFVEPTTSAPALQFQRTSTIVRWYCDYPGVSNGVPTGMEYAIRTSPGGGTLLASGTRAYPGDFTYPYFAAGTTWAFRMGTSNGDISYSASARYGRARVVMQGTNGLTYYGAWSAWI
jgi:hypothetical protein